MILKALGLSLRSKHRACHRLDQGFSMGGGAIVLHPQGALAMSGDAFVIMGMYYWHLVGGGQRCS